MKTLLLLLLTLALIHPSALAGANENVLRISGSSTVLPIAQRAAEYFMGLHPNLQLSVSGTGSGEGIKALVENATDIATSSRDLKPKEIERMEGAGIHLERHIVAIDCVVVVVHPDNPVSDLTLKQLKGLYDGQFQNWSDIGGFDKQVVAINRDVSSGTFETWLEMVLQGERYRRDAQMQTSSGGVAYAVSGNKYAIGYIGLGYVTPKVKVVTINGVRPSLSTIRNGQYPLARELYMFTRPDAPEVALKFIDFLTTPAGRRLVEKEGFVSVEATR
ncbi:phosphate ABC transporter substrate-binding protein [Deltaproteobacteria bacterium Smac51]|nr:phosphate ABC transporter substrate-binding protein [Deltaproteobacteria bacterium Smac51]